MHLFVYEAMCAELRVASLSLRLQSAGTFEEVEKPSPSYQKTRPVEAGKLSSTSPVFEPQL